MQPGAAMLRAGEARTVLEQLGADEELVVEEREEGDLVAIDLVDRQTGDLAPPARSARARTIIDARSRRIVAVLEELGREHEAGEEHAPTADDGIAVHEALARHPDALSYRRAKAVEVVERELERRARRPRSAQRLAHERP